MGRPILTGAATAFAVATLVAGVKAGERPWLELLGAGWQSKDVNDDRLRRSFDAQAWMFVHYLMFGDKGARQPQLNRFATLLRTGRPADAAFQEAFGDPKPLADGFDTYVDKKLYGYLTFKADLNVRGVDFAVRPLSTSAAAALRAGFLAAMKRPQDAWALLDEARRSEPRSVLVAEVEAVLLEREDKVEDALAACGRAIDGGSENFYVYYRRSALSKRAGSSQESLDRDATDLEQAVRLNPDHAWSQASLARVLSRLAPGERAVAAARKAVELEPGVAAHRLALVEALYRASRADEAQVEARAAAGLAVSDADRHDAQEWLDFLSKAVTPPR